MVSRCHRSPPGMLTGMETGPGMVNLFLVIQNLGLLRPSLTRLLDFLTSSPLECPECTRESICQWHSMNSHTAHLRHIWETAKCPRLRDALAVNRKYQRLCVWSLSATLACFSWYITYTAECIGRPNVLPRRTPTQNTTLASQFSRTFLYAEPTLIIVHTPSNPDSKPSD